MTYAGQPSLFEGRTIFPEGDNDVKLQILAADHAGNTGQHAILVRVAP